MKITDIIFALICGKVVGFVVADFLRELGIAVGFYGSLVLWLVFPLLALGGLWLCQLIGRKILFVLQAGKHLLVGAAATVFDLKFFEWLVWSFSFIATVNPIAAKSMSFIFSTLIKYW